MAVAGEHNVLGHNWQATNTSWHTTCNSEISATAYACSSQVAAQFVRKTANSNSAGRLRMACPVIATCNPAGRWQCKLTKQSHWFIAIYLIRFNHVHAEQLRTIWCFLHKFSPSIYWFSFHSTSFVSGVRYSGIIEITRLDPIRGCHWMEVSQETWQAPFESKRYICLYLHNPTV